MEDTGYGLCVSMNLKEVKTTMTIKVMISITPPIAYTITCVHLPKIDLSLGSLFNFVGAVSNEIFMPLYFFSLAVRK